MARWHEPAEAGGPKVSRRAALAGACAAAALAGCGRPTQLLRALGVPTRLSVRLIGFPKDAAAGLISALQRAVLAYEKAHRGPVALDIRTSLAPDRIWFGGNCPPVGACPGPAQPAAPLSLFQVTGADEAGGQIGDGGVPQLLVLGRTRLNVRFGRDTLPSPEPASTASQVPDIIIAYDLWQYWLAVLATDVAETWKALPDDRDGLPSDFQRYARFVAQAQGTFAAAFPILRNPMMIVNAEGLGEVQPWDWSHFAEAVSRYTGRFPLDTSRFVQEPLYPEATELASALVAAFGGRLAGTTPSSATPTFTAPEAVTALSKLATIAAGDRGQPHPGGGVMPLYPSYMWNPLGGVREPFGLSVFHSFPLPAGPSRSAVPCTYLCATVPATSAQTKLAQDFASFLMSRPAQAEFADWPGGLPLRQPDALPIVLARFPYVGRTRAEQLASAAGDLTAADLYGGDETRTNATAYDGIADLFASALHAVQAPPVDPGETGAILTQAGGPQP